MQLPVPVQKSANTAVKTVRSADGTKIYADAVGSSANPALIFVHGFSSSAAIFDDIFTKPENSSRFYLVRYDVRGHGRSGKPSDPEAHSSQRFAEDFAAVLKAFDVKKPIFVGWSMGGRILADIASYLPSDTLLGAVSLASAPYSDAKMQSIATAAMGSLIPGLLSTNNVLLAHEAVLAANRLLFLKDPNPSAEFITETTKAAANGADFREENPEISWNTRCASIGMAAHMSAADRLLAFSRQQDNTKILELARGGFPLLVIYGTHDGYMSGEKMLEVVRPDFVNLDVKMIQGGSHAPFLEKPDEIMNAIFGFARRLAK